MAMFALIESPELVNESVLGFHGDGDDLGRLTLSAAFEDEVGAGIVTIVPGGLDEQPACVDVAGFSNRTTPLSFTGGVLHRDQSGGTDSTYCLYVTKTLGLRPLAVHIDNGFVSETATANIKATAERLNVEVRTVTTNWEALRGLYRACLEASIPEICLPCEVGVYSALHRVAAEVGARYIILGLSYKTEGITPLAWHYCDGLYIADVFKRHGAGDRQPPGFDGLALTSFAKHAFWHRIRTVQLPLYMRDYRDKEIHAELARELGWVYGGHHHFDRAYKPFVAHIQARKFNIDYRKVTLSALVRTGQSARQSALASLQQVPTATDAEVKHCLETLGLTPGDLDRILATPARRFRDYRTYYSLVRRMKLPLRLMAHLGIVPETTYEKLFET